MSGNYHFGGDFNQRDVNATNAHPGGFFEDTTIPRGGFYGPVSNVDAASGNATSSYASYGNNGAQSLQTGGRGYGMSLTQDLLGGMNNRYPLIDSYDSVGGKNELNLAASTQYNPLSNVKSGLSSLMTGGKGKRNKMRSLYGGANLTSYGYDITKGGSDDVSLYKGSYAPISVTNSDTTMRLGSNPNSSLQLGGNRKRRAGKTMRKLRYKTKSKNGGRGKNHKHTKYCKHKSKSRSRRYRKSRNGGNPFKMTKKILEKIVGGNGTCGGPPSQLSQSQGQTGGGYSQYLGGQEFSQGYTIDDMVTPQTSSLANPMPFKPYNSCQ